MLFCEAVPIQNANDPSVHRVFRGRASAHLMSDKDGEEAELELVDYATSIGMHRTWLQDRGQWRAHYDLTGKFLTKVFKDDSVLKLDRVSFAAMLRRKRMKHYNIPDITYVTRINADAAQADAYQS